MVEKYFVHLLENSNIKLLLIFIIFDIVFGILRAIKERKLNSTIGIDGMIRKAGMILSDCFLFIIDRIIKSEAFSDEILARWVCEYAILCFLGTIYILVTLFLIIKTE